MNQIMVGSLSPPRGSVKRLVAKLVADAAGKGGGTQIGAENSRPDNYKQRQ
jgi:hypothetical protein